MRPQDDDQPNRAPEFIENSTLLRQLFYDRRFRIGAAAVFLAVAALGLSIPRIFVVSPPSMEQKVRVSLLGRIQARSLTRTAERLAAAGQWEDSLWSWRSALQHNAGDLDANRGLLKTLAQLPDPRRKYLDLASMQSAWLLQLSETNQEDLSLITEVFRHYEADDLTVNLLAPKVAFLGPKLIGRLAEADFRLGNINHFGDLRSTLGTNIPPGNEWRLYDAAWRWGWGPIDGAAKGRQELEEAGTDPNLAGLVNHLRLQVAFSRSDLTDFERALEQLVRDHADRPLDHANHWELMAQSGHRSDAADLAKAYNAEPSNAAELLLIAREYSSLGLVAEAAALLQKQRASFNYSSELWAQIASLYIEGQDWRRLRELAIDLRSDPVQSGEMPGYGWYLEGLANFKQGSAENAGQSFARAADTPIKSPIMAYRAATGIAKLGYPESSAKILGRLDQWFGKSDEYWFSLALSGYQAGDFELFLTASRRAYELAPKKLAIINNLAAACLLLRQMPAESVRLTLECVAANPKNPGFRINHALALVLNSQGAEADKVLQGIDFARLSPDEKSLYHYARFQIYYSNGSTNLCRQEIPQIELRHLKAEQSKWMRSAMLQIGVPQARN